MASAKPRGAVIGCGAISKLHLESMQQAGYEITALCDIDPARAEGRKAEYGDEKTQVFTDHKAMLVKADVDVVGILTPPFLHKDQTVDCLKAGAYVYTEKPVVRTLAEFDEIFAAEEGSGKQAFVTTSRFRGAEGPMIKQYVESGELGHIYRVEAQHFRTRGRPGVDQMFDARWFADSRKALAGIMGDMGMYFMDRCFYFTDWPTITSVSAVAMKEFPFEVPEDVTYDVEEHMVILARTDSKLTFTFEFANIAHHDHVTTFKMLGTKGGLAMDGRTDGIKFRTEKGGPWRFVEETCTWKESKKSDVIIYEQIAAALRGEGPVTRATTSQQALALHTMVAMAYRSSKEGREIRPDELDPQAPIFVKSW